MPCYYGSDHFKGVYSSRKTGIETACKGCGAPLYQPRPSEGRHPKKYCNMTCKRRFYAERFDKHVDSYTITVPQCFDEFMTQDVLPCLVDGCDWKGHGLAQHMNHAHNITADEARERGGFNRSTGLVSQTLREQYADRNANSGGLNNFNGNIDPARRRGISDRAEAKEHHTKAALIGWASRREGVNENG
jgi:hypothetical protein